MTGILIGSGVTVALSLIGVIFQLGRLFQKVDDIAAKVDGIVRLEDEVDCLKERTTRLEVNIGMRRVDDAA